MDSKEFMEELQYDLHEDEVFVFTPKGEIVEMPKGATVLDYAFRIHTDVGLHARGGKINGRMVTLRTELKSGDQVEIITEKNSKPSPIWLRIVKTPSARQKLRAYFRRIQEESQKETIASVLENSTPVIDENTLKEIKKLKSKNPLPKHRWQTNRNRKNSVFPLPVGTMFPFGLRVVVLLSREMKSLDLSLVGEA